jgi:hypothetical protein
VIEPVTTSLQRKSLCPWSDPHIKDFGNPFRRTLQAMAHQPCLSELSPDASTSDTRDALNTLAIRYAMLAAEREVSQQQGGAQQVRTC